MIWKILDSPPTLKTWLLVIQTAKAMTNTQMISKTKMSMMHKLSMAKALIETMKTSPLMRVCSSWTTSWDSIRSSWAGQELMKVETNLLITSSHSPSLTGNRESRKPTETLKSTRRWILNIHKHKSNHSSNGIKNRNRWLNRRWAPMSSVNCMKCLSWKSRTIPTPEKGTRESRRSAAATKSWWSCVPSWRKSYLWSRIFRMIDFHIFLPICYFPI